MSRRNRKIQQNRKLRRSIRHPDLGISLAAFIQCTGPTRCLPDLAIRTMHLAAFHTIQEVSQRRLKGMECIMSIRECMVVILIIGKCSLIKDLALCIIQWQEEAEVIRTSLIHIKLIRSIRTIRIINTICTI
jgi:hypothetical protein